MNTLPFNGYQDWVKEIVAILSKPTIYNTPPVFSLNHGLLYDQLAYRTINEEYVVQKIIQNYQHHQQKKKEEATAWRVGVGIAATLLGLGNGFQLGDLLGGVVAGNLAGKIADSIHDLDGLQRKELGLEILNSPESYLYHQKRHRGHAVRRMLTITHHSNTGEPCTAFAVQFPDGYVAYLVGLEKDSVFAQQDVGRTQRAIDKDLVGLEKDSVFAGQFCVSGFGFDIDWVQRRTCLAELPTNASIRLPIELWHNDQGNSVMAIPYKAPHHSIY